MVPFLGRRMPLTYQVTSYQPGHEVMLAASNGLLRATDTDRRDRGHGRLGGQLPAEVRLRGPLRVLDPLLRPGFRAVGRTGRPPASRRPCPGPAPGCPGGAGVAGHRGPGMTGAPTAGATP